MLKEKNNGSQVRAYLIILLVLIPYFLFTTGAMYQICGAPIAYTLNSEGEGYDREYVHDSESCGAKWLAINGEENTRVYATDGYGALALPSQGKIASSRIDSSYSFSKHKQLKEGYIYLCYNNVVKGKLMVKGMPCNMTEYSDMFIGKSKVYNSGCAEVYK